MGFINKCSTCNNNLIFTTPIKCILCESKNCNNCVEKFKLSDFCGNPKFITRKNNLTSYPFAISVDGKFHDFGSFICLKCMEINDLVTWKDDFFNLKEKANEINVINVTSFKFDAKKSRLYKVEVIGGKIDLIQSLKINAYRDGYDYIYELTLEKSKEGWSNWKGTCKAYKKQDF